MASAHPTAVAQFREALHLKDGQPISLNALSKFYKSTYIANGNLQFETLPAEISRLFTNCSDLVQKDPDNKPYFDIYHIVRDYPYSESYIFDTEQNSRALLVCGSQSAVYQWGYSLLVIYFMSFHGKTLRSRSAGSHSKVTSTGLWVMGTYITWLHTQRLRNGQLNRCGRGFGPYRAMIDLAGAIHEELGSSIGAYSDKEIEKELAKRSPVKYVMRQSTEAHNTDSSKEQLVRRLALSPDEGDGELDHQD